MTLEDLKQDNLYHQLTEQQKQWVVGYIDSNRNLIEATMKAYDCKDEKSARALGRQMRNRADIVALLDKYFGQEPPPSKEQFMQRIWKSIQSCSNPRDMNPLAILYARLRGWDKGGYTERGERDSKNHALRELLDKEE
jgi:hypothetical protein